ncbi:MAG: amidohydrolase family protein [Clostridia bacterium]|nr:amidohydrolase family protein [Clostridia bacterium]
MKYAFANLTLYGANGSFKPLENMTVLTDGDIITDILDSDKKIPAGYRRINLKGKYMIPGMINLSSHLFSCKKDLNEIKDIALQKAIVGTFSQSMAKGIPDKIATENMESALHSGITTVRIMGDSHYSDVRVRNIIKNTNEKGPRIIASGPAITAEGGYGDGLFAVSSGDCYSLSIHVDAHAAIDTDYIRIIADRHLSGDASPVMTPEMIKTVTDRAHLLGYKVSAYCEQNKSVISALENGVDIIEGYADATVDTVKLMKEKGASLILSISPMLSLARLSQTLTSLDSEKASRARERIKGAVHFARLAILAGIPVGIGSGASLPFVTHYSFFRELYFFSKYCAVSPLDAIKTATLTNASLLGLDGVLGSIDKGKTADMVILSSDPAKDITALSKPVAVVRAGDLIDKLSIKKNPESDRLADLLM